MVLMKRAYAAVALLLGAAVPQQLHAQAVRVDAANVRRELTTLAHDSMQGRRVWTPGAARAARYIAGMMTTLRLTPGGDNDTFIQRIPGRINPQNGRGGAVASFAAHDSLPAAERTTDANVIGILRGSDPVLRDEWIVVAAHYDHLGIRPSPTGGDSIANGADDDASGVVAMLEIARALRANPPKRSIAFVAFTGEESGGIGTRWYMSHPAAPLDKTVAQFQIEMIGRPDSLVGGPGKAWLTGYERSTMGDILAKAGVPVVVDPRPTQNFFSRSDNYAFAMQGIPAHTFSSFDPERNKDYHKVSDDVDKVDFAHMTSMIEWAIAGVRVLADGPKPTWLPGMQPTPRTPR
jgi:hypothetical protein